MFLIEESSPFRRLPSDLVAQDRVQLDAIRFAVEMIDQAYYHLCQILLDISKFRDSDKIPHSSHGLAIMYLWIVIDSLYRLKFILEYKCTTNLFKDNEVVKFINCLPKELKDIRDYIQHINDSGLPPNKLPSPRLQIIADKNLSLWGALAWITLSSENRCFSHQIVPGTFSQGSQENFLVNPAGKAISGPIDHITFYAYEHPGLNISELRLNLAYLVKYLEALMSREFVNTEAAGGDLYASLEYIPSEK